MTDDKPDSGDVQRLFEEIVGDMDLSVDDYLDMTANLLKHHHERLHGRNHPRAAAPHEMR